EVRTLGVRGSACALRCIDSSLACLQGWKGGEGRNPLPPVVSAVGLPFCSLGTVDGSSIHPTSQVTSHEQVSPLFHCGRIPPPGARRTHGTTWAGRGGEPELALPGGVHLPFGF